MSKIKSITISLIIGLALFVGFSSKTYADTTTTWVDEQTNIEFKITIKDDGTKLVEPQNITQGQANLSLVAAQQRAEQKAQELAEEHKNSSTAGVQEENKTEKPEENGTAGTDKKEETDKTESTESDKKEETEAESDKKENARTYEEQKSEIITSYDAEKSGSNTLTIAGQSFDLANLNASSDAICIHRDQPMPGEGNGSYQITIGGSTYNVGKNPIGNIQIDKKVTGSDTSETANKYHETKRMIVGETVETAALVYVCSFYEQNTRWDSELQQAIWSMDIALGRKRPKNDLAKEADAYAEFFAALEKVKQENNGSAVKDTIVDPTTATDISAQEKKLGPFTINYARGVTKQGARDKVDFGGISGMKLIDNNGKEISQNAWRIVTVNEIEGKQRNIPEYDNDYKYPYPNEQFYIIVNTDKLSDVTAISKIAYEYSAIDVVGEVAYMEGTYQQITWEGREFYKICRAQRIGRDAMGRPVKQPCGHGSLIPHKYDVKYYISQTARQDLESQEMIVILNIQKERNIGIYTIPTIPDNFRLYIPSSWGHWPYWPDYPDYPDRPHGDLTFTIAGFVWEDERTGKESDYDGQIGTANSGEPESGIKNVEVRLYKHGTTEAIKSTYTDASGAYVFNEIPVGTYDVGFVYDGMTYTTTKSFASGSSADYQLNPNDEKYILDSKAEELPAERQAFNNKFYEISAEGSENVFGIHEVDASQDAISYLTRNGVSKLQTTYADGKVKEPFKLETKTSNTITVGYPLTNYVNNATASKVINGQTYQENYKYMAYVNLGLKKRPEVDFALTKDVYTSTITINSKQIDYKYNSRNAEAFDIQLKNSISYSDVKYNREIYKTDYNYKIDNYKTSNLNTVNGATIRGLKEEDQELKVFVTYKIRVRNQSEIYSGTINELVDYFDANYNLISTDLKLDIRNDDGTIVKDKVVARAPYYETSSGKTGSLSVTTPAQTSSKNYMKTYISGIQNEILQTGEDIYLYITFEVDKDDATRNVKLGEKSNQVEITNYSTFDALAVTKTNTMGMIDRDSAPGNLEPENSLSLEDDSDIAPTINIKFYEAVTRTINGTVWEDQRRDGGTNTFTTGDGLKQETENKIDGVLVQLIEIVTAEDGSQYEYIWQEMYSGASTYQYVNLNGTVLDGSLGNVEGGSVEVGKGEYKFTGYIPGDYIVRFKYGDTTRTVLTGKNNTSYNGQDYKSTVYLQGENINREWYDLGSAYLSNTPMSDAKDNEARRIDVINYSKQMKFDIAEVLASHEDANASSTLHNELIKNTWMYADTAKMRVEVEYDTTKIDAGQNLTYNIRDIDFGLVERPKANIDLSKQIVGIKITLADGSVLIDTEAGVKRNVNWVDNRVVNGKPLKGAIHIYMDEEVMRGANIQIKYRIIVANNSELDYTGTTSTSVGKAYYTGVPSASDRKVTTSIDLISDYVDNSLVYREDDNAGRGWVSMEKTSLESIAKMEQNGYLDPDVKLESKNIHQIILNEALKGDALIPGEERTIELTLTKTLSSGNDEEDPTFDNIAEILQYTNTVGRRADIPGNQDPTQAPIEGDADWTETVTITPPTGENKAYYFVITGVVLAMLAVGVVVIKRKVLDK